MGRKVGKAGSKIVKMIREVIQLADEKAAQALKNIKGLVKKVDPPKLPRNSRDDLLKELAEKNIKHSPDAVVGVARRADGTIVFLEKGGPKAGLQHITDAHADDFLKRGVKADEIPDLVMKAATEGKQVGMQGSRPIYEVVHNGQRQLVAVTVGSNGFIVGANPATLR